MPPSKREISVESIVRDLESEKPIWPLSSYGPAKLQPTLIANLDESPEELRVKAAEAARKGTVQEYVRLYFPPLCKRLFNAAISS
ncbi:hypothetical protein NUW54_g7432 [Trametes sanguinea]|uniref:Uncharacterized protein n=1 Tax=Trametes sanguinea TaxID=158606 RepID=A0ACC1PKP0_9APHY|nr:hypothetical protein NUW54_g7432 [Trametes sanguinea]